MEFEDDEPNFFDGEHEILRSLHVRGVISLDELRRASRLFYSLGRIVAKPNVNVDSSSDIPPGLFEVESASLELESLRDEYLVSVDAPHATGQVARFVYETAFNFTSELLEGARERGYAYLDDEHLRLCS